MLIILRWHHENQFPLSFQNNLLRLFMNCIPFPPVIETNTFSTSSHIWTWLFLNQICPERIKQTWLFRWHFRQACFDIEQGSHIFMFILAGGRYNHWQTHAHKAHVSVWRMFTFCCSVYIYFESITWTTTRLTLTRFLSENVLIWFLFKQEMGI